MTWQIWLISHCHFFPSTTRRLNCGIVSVQCSKCVACNLNYTRTKTKTGSNLRHWNQAKFMSSQLKYFLRHTALLCSILIMQQNPSKRIHEELIGDFVFLCAAVLFSYLHLLIACLMQALIHHRFSMSAFLTSKHGVVYCCA